VGQGEQFADHMKALKSLVIKMPSEEELRASSLLWLAQVRPTLIDQWPADVLALSMPTKFVRLPVGMLSDLYDHGGSPPDTVTALANELDAQMGWERHFIRLNSRSPKDALWPFEVGATCSGKEAMGLIMASERCLDDLCFFEHVPEQPAYICLREFACGLRPEGEYRCFVKDGRLIAITRYDYLHLAPAPADGGKEIRGLIDRWFAETLAPRLHLQTVVFDVYLGWGGEILLVELNPYGRSDPCFLQSYEAVENFSGYIATGPLNAGSKSREDQENNTLSPPHQEGKP
jgi:hypothetical protein